MSAQSGQSASSTSIRLVVGLGNPGRKYEDTRHNVGFMILDRLAARTRESWADEKKWETQILRSGDRIFLKPQTFMNASGQAVAGVANFYKIPAEQLLVVYDDVDLPLGRMRFRADGSAGGHNGIKSIIACLGSQQFPRLKVGIGRSEISQASTVGHVLGKFGPEEAEKLEKSLQDAVSAIEYALARGLDAAMNEFNRREKPPKPKKQPESKQPESEPKTSEPGTRDAPDEPAESK